MPTLHGSTASGQLDVQGDVAARKALPAWFNPGPVAQIASRRPAV